MYRRIMFFALVLTGLACRGAVAQSNEATGAGWQPSQPSQPGARAFANPGVDYPSIMLAGALDDDPFALDGRFHNGQMFADRFGAYGSTTDKHARKAVRLPNGDVVTVALVPKLGATADPASGVGYNIGMVRYSATGVRQTWPYALASYTDAGKSYYVYPNKDVYDLFGSYQSIIDVKEHNGWIYVLATRSRSASDLLEDVRLVRFSLTSSSSGWYNILTSQGFSDFDAYGAGMHFYMDGGLDRLVVVAGRPYETGVSYQPIAYETWMRRYIVSGVGTLTPDSSFGTDGALNLEMYGDNAYRAVAIAGSSTLIGALYIAATVNVKPGYMDAVYVLKRDKDGLRVKSFHGQGTMYMLGGNSVAVDIVVEKVRHLPVSFDAVYVLSRVDSVCATTLGAANIFKLHGDGTYPFWSGEWSITFGGEGGLPSCFFRNEITPRAIALNGRRLAVVGYSTRHWGLSVTGGPSLSIIDKDTGVVSDSRILKPAGVDIGGNGGNGDSTFYAVTASETDSFYAVGSALDTQGTQKYVPITARVRTDRIFGDGLE